MLIILLGSLRWDASKPSPYRAGDLRGKSSHLAHIPGKLPTCPRVPSQNGQFYPRVGHRSIVITSLFPADSARFCSPALRQFSEYLRRHAARPQPADVRSSVIA